jgi:hypothetical protein
MSCPCGGAAPVVNPCEKKPTCNDCCD